MYKTRMCSHIINYYHILLNMMTCVIATQHQVLRSEAVIDLVFTSLTLHDLCN